MKAAGDHFVRARPAVLEFNASVGKWPGDGKGVDFSEEFLVRRCFVQSESIKGSLVWVKPLGSETMDRGSETGSSQIRVALVGSKQRDATTWTTKDPRNKKAAAHPVTATVITRPKVGAQSSLEFNADRFSRG